MADQADLPDDQQPATPQPRDLTGEAAALVGVLQVALGSVAVGPLMHDPI